MDEADGPILAELVTSSTRHSRSHNREALIKGEPSLSFFSKRNRQDQEGTISPRPRPEDSVQVDKKAIEEVDEWIVVKSPQVDKAAIREVNSWLAGRAEREKEAMRLAAEKKHKKINESAPSTPAISEASAEDTAFYDSLTPTEDEGEEERPVRKGILQILFSAITQELGLAQKGYERRQRQELRKKLKDEGMEEEEIKKKVPEDEEEDTLKPAA